MSMLARALATAFVVISMASCARREPPSCGPTRGRFDLGAVDSRYEPACLAVLGPLARRDGPTLTLALTNGTTKTFTNEGGKTGTDEQDKRVIVYDKHFSLAAYDPAAPTFVIQADDGGLVAIDARDGHETRFDVDFPHSSPGGALALTVADQGTGAITVRDVSDSPPKVVWRDAPAHPVNRSFIAWDGDRKARLLVEDTSIATIARDDAGQWTYATTPMEEPKIAPPPTCMPDPVLKEGWKRLDACLARLDGMVIDNGTLLSLRLEDGRRKRLVGDDTEGYSYSRHYALAGWDARAHLYVVRVAYYEGGSTTLVDSRTGAETDLDDGDSALFPSPDTSLSLAVTSSLDENAGIWTEVSIVVREPTPKKVWSQLVAERFEAVDRVLGWDGNRQVRLALDDGRTATVSQDDKGAWRYETSGTPKPGSGDAP